MAKKYDILDANEKIGFPTIYEAINNVIGTNYSGWMKACWPNNKGNDKFRMWFPKLAETRNGQLVSAAFDCVNTISDDWNQVVFDKLTEQDTIDGEYYYGYDLIFAKEPDGPYLFRGVFIRDDANSRIHHDVSKRVSTKVRLIGNPVYDIELLDEVEYNSSISKDVIKTVQDTSKTVRKKRVDKPIVTTAEINRPKTRESKLKNRILREFKKKKLLGDIQISDDEFEILVEYFRKKYKYIRTSGQHSIIDPVFCVALIQIGIRYYDGAFWSHVKKLLEDEQFNVNHQGWIGTSFAETLKRYDKIQVGISDRVDTILMHGFVSNVFAEKFFNFLYAFYKIDLDRDINRLDSNTMNELISIIEKNDNSGRTYYLVEHTADAVRQNPRGAKIRIRRYLKLIDKAFWGDPLPSTSSTRLMQRFLEWKDTEAEFVQEKTAHGGNGKRGKKSYASPYIKYNGKTDTFKIVLPAQIIKLQDFTSISWCVESAHYSDIIDINPYTQGITGYKTEVYEIEIMPEELFDEFSIKLLDGDEKLRSFRITKEPIRFFDSDGDFIRNDSVPQGAACSFTMSGFAPESEAIVESFDNGILLRTTYDFVNGDIVRIPDGKPITIGGKVAEGVMNRGSVSGVFEGEFGERVPVYREIPELFVKMLPQRAVGTAIKINNQIYRFSSGSGVNPGISEFDLMDRSGERGYLIKLNHFGCSADGEYSISLDVPNDRTIRKWKFALIKNLEFEFEEAPYIFKSRGTISFPKVLNFMPQGEVREELQERRRFNFDIEPGKTYLPLSYHGMDINFEIPTISYRFHGDEWHIGPHVDIWHSEFDPKLFITYNADKIRVFLDDVGDDEEHTETFYKNKSKGLFECDLTRFKSWFGREKIFRQIYMELPNIDEPIPFIKIVTQSIFNSGLIKADFDNGELIGEFDIIGYSDYFVDIEFEGNKIVERAQLKDKQLRVPSDLKTGIYKVSVWESEEDESGFGDAIYYEIGSFKSELLNPKDLSGMNIEITMLRQSEDTTSYLPLSTSYQVVDLEHVNGENLHVYKGKMIVGKRPVVKATFPVLVDFFDLDKLQKTYITFIEDDVDSDGIEFLYDDYKQVIVKQEDVIIDKSKAYRRFKVSLYPEDYVFEIKFIERPVNADDEVNDEAYNNLRKERIIKNYMSESIFKR